MPIEGGAQMAAALTVWRIAGFHLQSEERSKCYNVSTTNVATARCCTLVLQAHLEHCNHHAPQHYHHITAGICLCSARHLFPCTHISSGDATTYMNHNEKSLRARHVIMSKL